MRRFIASSLVLSLSRGLGIALQAAILVGLAHQLSLNDMGVFGLIYALLGVIRYIGPLGTDQVALRHASQLSASSPQEAENICNSSSVVTLVSGLAATFAFIIVTLLWNPGRLSLAEIVAVASAVPAFALMGSFAGQIRGLGGNLTAQMPEAVGMHLVFGSLLLVTLSFSDLDREYAVVALAVTSWTVSLVYFWIRLQRGSLSRSLPSQTTVIQTARSGVHVVRALALTALSTRMPLFLSSILVGSGGTALMDMASRFAKVPEITTNSVAVTFSPQFARLAHHHDRKATLETLRLSALIAAPPALAWLVVVAMAAPLAIGIILPDAYAGAYVPMVLLTVAVAINACLGLASTLLIMTSRERVVQLYSVAQLVGIVLVSLVLAPRLGVLGLAVAAVVGSLIRDGGMMAHVVATGSRALPDLQPGEQNDEAKRNGQNKQ